MIGGIHMLERKYATYFELVDLLERIFPPKSEFNYIKISPQDLIAKFDEEVATSGFYFKEGTLVNARNVIAEVQKITYNRHSRFLGARDDVDYGFDQNNYSIQNYLSEMKVRILSMMHNQEDLIHPGHTFGVTKLGSVEELRGRLTKQSIKEYVGQVLRASWEEKDTIRPEIYTLVADILYHFGISNQEFLSENKTSEAVYDAISNLEFKSRDFHGPMHHDGGQTRHVPDPPGIPPVSKASLSLLSHRGSSSLQHRGFQLGIVPHPTDNYKFFN